MAVGDAVKVPKSLKMEIVGASKDRIRITFTGQFIGGSFLCFLGNLEKLQEGTFQVAWANFVPDNDAWKNRVKSAP